MTHGRKQICRQRLKRGQAMVELVVALVVLLVLFAGIVQLSSLGLLQTRMMTEARREAGAKAMLDVGSLSGPDYISERTAGPDEVRYSRDDGMSRADPGLFQAGMVRYAHPALLNEQCPSNAVSLLYETAFPELQFGLVSGEAHATTNLLPIVRNLLYRVDVIDIEGKAWLTWTKGLYEP